MAAIVTNDLTKRYGVTTAVNKLSLSIQSGEIYGYLGPNGAGKTTTMQMLTTLAQPTSGTASINGAPLTNRDRVRRQIGYLPESPPLYPELTAYEQLNLAGGLRDLSSSFVSKRIESLLQRLELADDADKRIGEYSKGMQQKTAFIQAVLHEPSVVFLDEPIAGLDPRAGQTLRDMIVELASEGTTVFLSTHILPVAEQVSDTVGILYKGQLVAEDSPEKLKQRTETGEQRTLEDAFLEVTNSDPLETRDTDL